MKTANELTSRKSATNLSGGRSAALACLAMGIGALMLTGCAQYAAMNQPKPFKPTASVVGAERATVTCELGAPVVSTTRNDQMTETYKYTDGGSKNNAASKTGRVIIYTAGDLFTIFLDQLLTWPLETYAFAGTSHVVTVDYVKGSDGFWWAKEVRDVEQGKPQKAGAEATATGSKEAKNSQPSVTDTAAVSP